MPPNIMGISLVADEAEDETANLCFTIYHVHGPDSGEEGPSWGYTADEANPAAYVDRLIDSLERYQEGDEICGKTVEVVHDSSIEWEGMSEDGRRVLYSDDPLSAASPLALAEALRYKLGPVALQGAAGVLFDALLTALRTS